MFVVSFPSPSVLLGGPLNIATNYFEGNLNYFCLSLSLSSLASSRAAFPTQWWGFRRHNSTLALGMGGMSFKGQTIDLPL